MKTLIKVVKTILILNIFLFLVVLVTSFTAVFYVPAYLLSKIAAKYVRVGKFSIYLGIEKKEFFKIGFIGK